MNDRSSSAISATIRMSHLDPRLLALRADAIFPVVLSELLVVILGIVYRLQKSLPVDGGRVTLMVAFTM